MSTTGKRRRGRRDRERAEAEARRITVEKLVDPRWRKLQQTERRRAQLKARREA